MRSAVIAGLIVIAIGFTIMVRGIILFLYSINCGDVSFCYEEKSGVILMTMGALTTGIAINYLPYLNQIKSKTR